MLPSVAFQFIPLQVSRQQCNENVKNASWEGSTFLAKCVANLKLQCETHAREARRQLLVLGSETQWACGGRLVLLNTCCVRLESCLLWNRYALLHAVLS